MYNSFTGMHKELLLYDNQLEKALGMHLFRNYDTLILGNLKE